MSPKVVVAITTYNLEEYIAEALDSVLMQEIDFPCKIIVADDASTDRTVAILRDYAARYPDVIEVMEAENNGGSLVNSNRIFDHLACEYFSFLDGDDFWIDKDRLQAQVEILDSHPEYMICAGNTRYLVNGEMDGLVMDPADTGKVYTMEHLLHGEAPFFHTSSMLVRNTIFCNGLPQCYRDAENTFENCALRGEDFRRYLHMEQGPVYIMNDVISCYRIHERGMWQGSSEIKKKLETAISGNFYRKWWEEKIRKNPSYVYFSQYAEATYQDLIKEMIAKEKLFPKYTLSEEEHFLFISLLNDICAQKVSNGDEK